MATIDDLLLNLRVAYDTQAVQIAELTARIKELEAQTAPVVESPDGTTVFPAGAKIADRNLVTYALNAEGFALVNGAVIARHQGGIQKLVYKNGVVYQLSPPKTGYPTGAWYTLPPTDTWGTGPVADPLAPAPAPLPTGMRGTWEDFCLAMRMKESSDNPMATNRDGALGLYQHHENTMFEIGWYTGDTDFRRPNDWRGQWTAAAKAWGVTSKDTYLGNRKAQDEAWRLQCAYNWKTYINAAAPWDLKKYVGKQFVLGYTATGAKIMSDPLTLSAIFGMMNLLGSTGTRNFLDSGGTTNNADTFGTTAADYFKLFNGYVTPYDGQ